MRVTKDQEPLVVCSVSPADDEAVQICKDWVKEQGFTSETHRIMRGVSAVWVEEKICQKQLS